MAKEEARVGGRRPIMALLDLLGRRWTLRILWELRDGPLTSRALRTAADEISPTVLQKRVDELRAARILDAGSEGYELTALGQELLAQLRELNAFAAKWARRIGG